VASPDHVQIAGIWVHPMSIPLREPFVIATGRMDATRSALVQVTLQDAGRLVTGLGEAAALPPVTREDQNDLVEAIQSSRMALLRETIDTREVAAVAARGVPGSRIARGGLEAAILDAVARLAGVPLHALLGGPGVKAMTELHTDITLSISDPERMAESARGYYRGGFSCFKVKVGRDWQADLASLRAVGAAVPDARFRLDANAGFGARDALALLDAALGDGLTIECFEQPCAAGDLDGMAEVTARAAVPVVADESFRGAEDLERIVDARAASAVNLKLGKLGGPLATLALARRARALGLRLMAGAMVETRIGLLAMAHVVAALGGVDWVDLDTAFLLAGDWFAGGWHVHGPLIRLTDEPGLGAGLAGGGMS
jgi:L-alanine-DL-glutamate epimerase-like enolase superfamily enzyme